jgi:hypothetical protein
LARLLDHLVGAAETEDFSRWLVAWNWHLPESKDRIGAVQHAASRMRRFGMTRTEAAAIIEEANRTRRHMSADSLARWLGLTYEMREKIGITTIGAIDVSRRQRAAFRKLKKKQAQERRRRTRGIKSRAEYLANNALSRTKPWEAMGISRRTWERRRGQCLATQQPIDASPCTPDSNLAGYGLASAPQ